MLCCCGDEQKLSLIKTYADLSAIYIYLRYLLYLLCKNVGIESILFSYCALSNVIYLKGNMQIDIMKHLVHIRHTCIYMTVVKMHIFKK